MSVSRHAIDTVFAQLKIAGEATYAELVIATKLSLPTIKNAISVLKMNGSVVPSFTKPVTFKAIETPPMPGQTLIVREALPPAELDSKMIEGLQKTISEGSNKDPILGPLFEKINEASPEQLNKYLVLFVNITQVIRERLTSGELDLTDIDPNSLKGKK